MAESESMIVDRITRYLRSPEAPSSFDDVALEAWGFQVAHSPVLRRLAERREARPNQIGDWREIPAVAATAFKSIDLTLKIPQSNAGILFRSSGTTIGQDRRSQHRHLFPDLYRETISRSFPDACLPPTCGSRVPILSLIPRFEAAPDSSLAFMIDHVVDRWGDHASEWAMGSEGLCIETADDWADGRTEEGRPSLIVATALALSYWLDALADADKAHRLPPGTVVFETGGFKGRRRALSRADLVAAIGERLGVEPGAIVREYGMTELTTQFYTRTLDGGDPDLFVTPPWARVRILDPMNLSEVDDGKPGLVSIFDLANLSSTLHLLTEDLGIAEAGGFRLIGRAQGAELRGCSLAAEELHAGG